MKKMSKLTKKLLLSALALGLAVVTLTTTTFAWYTSSTTASAGTGKAGTSTSTDDSSLMISSDGITFGTTANLPTETIHLIPVQYKEGSFVTKEDGATSTGDYYEFSLYFKTTSEESANVYIKSIEIVNEITTVGSLPHYDNLVSETGEGLPNGAKYAVDVVKALDMVVLSGDKASFDTTKETKHFALDKAGIGVDGFNGAADANVYYDKFMGTGTATSTAAATYNDELDALERSTVIGVVPSTTEGVLKVTFVIYLNGWDQYCFDACKGQDFKVNIVFSTDSSDSN